MRAADMSASRTEPADVALAEHLDAPLITRDAELQRGSGVRCAIDVIH
ncbi:hypothetical protein [Streptomyces sp. KR80]